MHTSKNKPPRPLCPCTPTRDYDNCCGQFLNKKQLPPSPEALMRSRYTAFVQQNSDYLFDTWHPETRPTRDSLTDDTTTRQWRGLKIIASQIAPDACSGKVEFIARYRINGRAFKLHEISTFQKYADMWVYHSGIFPPPC